ncbi:MAG: aminopeptidase P family protein [Clostridia bacterium]|nr:aminopeptidase P family protein [Clostridia bacterium]
MNKIEKLFNNCNADAFLITSQKNRYYFTGFNSTAGYLVLTKNGASFITDFRYGEMAQCVKEKGIELYILTYKESFEKVAAILKAVGARTVGFEDSEITVSEYNYFKEKFDGFELVPCGAALAKVKQVKTAEELACIEKAQDVTDKVFSHMLKTLKVGMTEIDVAVELECAIRKLGGSGLAFDTIIASGLNSSKPHAHPTDKKLENGDPVTMDFGARYEGYCSDMTRTVFMGEPNAEMRRIYNIVYEAQMLTLNTMKPGMEGREIDAIARGVIEKNGFGEYFQHGLGHSVGLDIHETPNANHLCCDKFYKNMLVTVEPGIYVSGVGGVRIEDMVVFTEDGIHNFTKSDKSLIVL